MDQRIDPALLTSKQAAVYLAVSERTFWKYVALGQVPRVQLGPNTVRFKKADLDSFIKKQTERPRRAADAADAGSALV